MKVLLVFGTRAEAIKMCPLFLEMEKTKGFDVRVCVTAQHRQMLDQVLQSFKVKPHYDLDVMKSSQTLNYVISEVVGRIDAVLAEFYPHMVLVHGDTTTALAAALAGFNRRISIGHVEAGLRSYDLNSPWPEEMNRQLITQLSSHHFAPTHLAAENLLKAGVSVNDIFVTGNTVVDALYTKLGEIERDVFLEETVKSDLILAGYELTDRKFILITAHRRESFGEGLEQLCLSIRELSLMNPHIDFVYPVHLNPHVQEVVSEELGGRDNIYLIDPLGYDSFVYLMSKSYIILTDSGGIQEEAPALGKPVVLMRDVTERPEGVSAGGVTVVGVDRSRIVTEVQSLVDHQDLYEKMSLNYSPYGTGNACREIIDSISNGNKLKETRLCLDLF